MQESATNEEDLYLGEYKVVQKHLSEGAEDDNETSVWEVSCKAVEGESTYILKRFPKKNPDAVKDFEREVAFQKHLKEKFKDKKKLLVNRMYDETSDDTHNVCVFEFCVYIASLYLLYTVSAHVIGLRLEVQTMTSGP